MAKQMIAWRASDETMRQIDELVGVLGDTKTGVLARAIDRLWVSQLGEGKRVEDTMTTWDHVLGNQLSAEEVLDLAGTSDEDELATWIEEQSRELWGDEHDEDTDWLELARQLLAD